MNEISCKKEGSFVHHPSAIFFQGEPKLRKASTEDHSIVIENKLAQNLATKTAMSITVKNERASETPKSPLMSVAHSMRTRLTKLSNRFNKADGRRGIRSSHSLSRSVLSSHPFTYINSK